jgi:hypothetical protein
MCIANKSESKNMSLLGELKNPNLCGCFDHRNWSVIALTLLAQIKPQQMNKSKQHANKLTKQYKHTPNLAPGF